MKLEIKHIAPYLPYGLETNKGKVYGFTTGQNDIPFVECEDSELYPLDEVKPLLKPLSELSDLAIDLAGYRYQKFTWQDIKEKLEDLTIGLEAYYFLLENHYDVFDLITNGLAEEK